MSNMPKVPKIQRLEKRTKIRKPILESDAKGLFDDVVIDRD